MGSKHVALNLYCIGCNHFDISPRIPHSRGSTMTGEWGGEEARAFCSKGHWQSEMGTDATREDFRRAMEKAMTCDDYDERTPPPDNHG